jgi:predicted site-specific integrase-resolvase
MGVSYKTAWRWWRAGKLDAYQVTTGAIVVRGSAPTASLRPSVECVAVCARLSGQRRAKRTTEKIVRDLTSEDARAPDDGEWEEVGEDATR